MRVNRIKQGKFIDLIYPETEERVILEAPHAAAPKREFYTDLIAWEIAERTGWGALISRISRINADLNRDFDYSPEGLDYQEEALKERQKLLDDALKRLNWQGEKIIYIALHGMKDRPHADIILGTLYGKLCPMEIRDIFAEKLSLALEVAEVPNRVVKEDEFPGHPSLIEFKNTFGENFFVIQVEISKTLRTKYTEEVIDALILAVKGILRKL